MKPGKFTLLAALAGSISLFSISAQAAAPREDLTKVYESGRAAFNKGDLATAKIAFAKLLKADPNFDLAKIYMAQICVAEAKWAARPMSQKISETAVIAAVDFRKIPLSDALEVLRREFEKAAPNAGPISLVTDLPRDVLDRPVSISVRNLPMPSFVDAVAYAGGIHIDWHQKGLAVTAATDGTGPDNPLSKTATSKMLQAAQNKVLPRINFEKVALADALQWLRRQADPTAGPLTIVEREPLPEIPITLDLRNIPLTEALRSVALVADLQVEWRPWGAGLRAKSSAEIAAGNTSP